MKAAALAAAAEGTPGGGKKGEALAFGNGRGEGNICGSYMDMPLRFAVRPRHARWLRSNTKKI
jgi:hypothetical protein